MNFESAKTMFMEFMALATDEDKQEFIQWINKDVLPEFEKQNMSLVTCSTIDKPTHHDVS